MICCFIEVFARSHDTSSHGSISSSGPTATGPIESVSCGTGKSHVSSISFRVCSTSRTDTEDEPCSIHQASSTGSPEGGDGRCIDAGSGLDRRPLSSGSAEPTRSPSQRVVQGWEEQGSGKGSRQGFGKSNYSGPSQEGGPWSAEVDYYSIDRESMMGQMARMLIRHERQLQSLQQDQKLHLFLRPASAVPLMVKVARTWRELMDAGKVRSSLRETMLRELIQELKKPYSGVQCQARDEGEGYADELDRQSGGVELSQMESRDPEGGAGSTGGEPYHRADPGGSTGNRESDQWHHDQALRISSPLSPALRDKLGPIHTRDRTSHRWRHSLEALQCADKLLGAASSCGPSSAGPTDSLGDHSVPAAVSLGERAPQPPPRLHLIGCDLLAIRLLNPTSSTCYMCKDALRSANVVEASLLRGMWWQVLLANLASWSQVCPRASLAETILFGGGCWLFGFLSGAALATIFLSPRCRSIIALCIRECLSGPPFLSPEERIAAYRRH